MPMASGSPPRPTGLPAAAVFNAADQEWELGERRGALQVGGWTWWRPDGTLLSTAEFDGDGALHGIARLPLPCFFHVARIARSMRSSVAGLTTQSSNRPRSTAWRNLSASEPL